MKNLSPHDRSQASGRNGANQLERIDPQHPIVRENSLALQPPDPVALKDLEFLQLESARVRLQELESLHDQSSGACAALHGGVLAEIKQRLPHGQWMPWVKSHYNKSHRTATDYVRLWTKFVSESKLAERCQFGGLLQDLAATLRQIEEAKLDIRHPLVGEVLTWSKGHSASQLMLNLGPSQRGGSKPGPKKKLNKSPDQIAREEAQVRWLPLQEKLFELLHSKAKGKLLFLPITAPAKEAQLSVLRNSLASALAHVDEAIKHHKRARKD